MLDTHKLLINLKNPNSSGNHQCLVLCLLVQEGLSQVLAKEFGRGFSVRNLEQMMLFYQVYSNSQTPSAKSKNFLIKQQTLSTVFELS